MNEKNKIKVNKYVSKAFLAKFLNMSPSTFSRFLRSRREVLTEMGLSPKAKLLPPNVTKYILKELGCDE